MLFRCSIILASALLGFLPWGRILANDCSDQLKAIDALRVKIQTDQNAIRRLNAGLAADELNNWADASEEERRKILKNTLTTGISTLADGLLSAPENALKPMDIAGYHLPNGIGSLGTGQANAIIGRLQSQGVANTRYGEALVSAVRKLSQTSNKIGSVEYVKALSTVASGLKDAAEMGASDETVDSAAAFFQLVADLAGKGSFAVQLSTALFQGGKNLLDAYLISTAVGPLAQAAESQLNALKILSANLQKDVQSLQSLKSITSCKDADISSILGINPDAVAAMKRCNEIAQTMVARQAELSAILRSCPKPAKAGEDPPPCPVYEAAAARNASINRSSMTCNKDSNGQYIPFFTGSGVSSRPPPTSAPAKANLDVNCNAQWTTCVEACPKVRSAEEGPNVPPSWADPRCQRTCQITAHTCCADQAAAQEAARRANPNARFGSGCWVALP